jgi:hypothetical protein
MATQVRTRQRKNTAARARGDADPIAETPARRTRRVRRLAGFASQCMSQRATALNKRFGIIRAMTQCPARRAPRL